MVLGYSLLRAYIAEDIQLLFVFSTHAFFLAGWAVETREFLVLELPSVRRVEIRRSERVNAKTARGQHLKLSPYRPQ
jgi:hypothetical protein